MIDYKINAAELERQIKQLPKRVQKKIVVGATRKGANVIAREMRKRAPVRAATGNPGVDLKNNKYGEFPRGPGFLKKNIRSKRYGKRRTNGASFEIGPVGHAFYGLMIEGGTRNMHARPWMRPAFAAKQREAGEAVIDAFWAELEKELRR